MDKTLRSILWVLVTLVLLSSFSAGWFFVAKEKLSDEYMDLEDLFKTSVARLDREIVSTKKENTELNSKLDTIEKEMNVLEARNRDLEFQYEEFLAEREDLNKELARVKKGRFFLEKKLNDMESENFIAGLLKEKVSLEVELARMKGALSPKEAEIKELERENINLDIRLSKLTEEKNLLEEKVKSSAKVAEILSRDVLKERDKNEQEKQEFIDAKMENRFFRTKISKLEEISGRFNKLFVEKENMQLKIAGLEKNLAYKNKEIDRLKFAFGSKRKDTEESRAKAYHSPDEVELPPIVLERQNRKLARLITPSLKRINRNPALTGRIVTANKEHHFVVIDLGKKDGINVGTGFDVYRNELLIGSVEVIQARERIAAADIKDVEEGFYIEIDDVIVKR